jgi:archaeosortase A (PGF-CTERM-specific)
MTKENSNSQSIYPIFFILPALLVISGLIFFPFKIYESGNLTEQFLTVILFVSLFLLLFGFFLKNKDISHKIKILGWAAFAAYWSTQINTLYYSENGDVFNVSLCIIGIFALFYFAYHEWLSMKKNEEVGCLNWAVGAAAIAGIVYFGIEKTPLAPWLIETVTAQSGFILNFFIGNVEVQGVVILYNGVHVVNIIFACTAVQSMVIFLGMILPLNKVEFKRKLTGLLITIVPIYFLNLIRNALIAYLVRDNPEFFSIAHNIIGKGLSLLALIILLFIVIKIVPEVFDEIICLTDLPKRNGPLERFIKSIFLRKK